MYCCVLLISFVVVLVEEGVQQEHTSFIAHVKGAKQIQLSCRFVQTHKIVGDKKCLTLL